MSKQVEFDYVRGESQAASHAFVEAFWKCSLAATTIIVTLIPETAQSLRELPHILQAIYGGGTALIGLMGLNDIYLGIHHLRNIREVTRYDRLSPTLARNHT